MLRPHPRWLTLLAPLLVCACGYNALDGSIDDTHALDFTRTRIVKQDQQLVVEYLRDSREAVEKVCKLVARLDGLELPADQMIELKDADFLQRVGLQRATLVDNGFPQIESGRLQLDQIVFEHGGTARGLFEVEFETHRSLDGWFDGVIAEIAPPP
ncbi:MAG: hypothetical protein ABIJ09_08330 [Pseudomonadota bacterium]